MAALDPRRLYLDRSPGELRGVVTLHGLPERLLIERSGEASRPRVGETWRGRVKRLAPAFSGAFVDLGDGGPDAFLKLGGTSARPSEGAAIELLVVAEARADKGPVVGFRALSNGPPGRLQGRPELATRLRAFAAVPVVEGLIAREAADLAEDTVLEATHAVPGGPILTIERTRALVAIDVDSPDSHATRRWVMDANLDALRHAARLLRLKSLGGLIIVDLIGRPRDAQTIGRVAREAFEADEPGVLYGQVSRSGVLELGKPHRDQPLVERLCAFDGRVSARTVAQRLIRALDREGRADPGARLQARCAPVVAAELRPLARELGPRFSVCEDIGRDRLDTDIQSQ